MKVLPRMNAQRLQMMQSDWGDRETSDLALRNIFWVTLSCYTCLFFNTNLARKRLWGEISQPICCVLDAKTGALLAIFFANHLPEKALPKKSSRISCIKEVLHDESSQCHSFAWFPFPFLFSRELSALQRLNHWDQSRSVGPGGKSIC